MRSRTLGLLRLLTLGLVLAVLTSPFSPAPVATADPPPAQAPGATPSHCPGQDPARPDAAPVLAHFYIWFNTSSWARAKTDYPEVGRYSSNSVPVMVDQVEQARAAGIDGFIVSWKSTDQLDARLADLREVAAEHDFRLAITYQAQDFARRPLPVDQVRQDLQTLADTYADDPVFHILGSRPLVALSGTWHYSEADLRSIIEPVSSQLLVLATEKNVEGYERVASAVEGELYYWSSVDPLETPGFEERLLSMANAVREDCGVWVAPVTPGFDARLVGGTRTVDRRDGATLRRSWEAALGTVPDAIGVISWNEFSENTHIEPSTRYGPRYLDVLAELTGAPAPPGGEVDSGGPEGTGSVTPGILAVAAVVTALVAVTVFGIHRRRPDRR